MSPRNSAVPILSIVLAAVTTATEPIPTLIVARRAWDRGAPGLTVEGTAEALCALAAAGFVTAMTFDRWAPGLLRVPVTPELEAVHARAVARRRRARGVR